MNSESDSGKLVIADRRSGADGKPNAFLLRNRKEEIVLEPGKTWAQLDTFKWVTRGLIDEPSGFHVLADGTVEIHGEHIRLDDADCVAHLEASFNQHLAAPVPKPARPTVLKESRPAPRSNKVVFKVRLDRLGHLMVTALRGAEKVETGIRGLDGLVRNGLMLKPNEVHLDPLLAYVEIDGARFESNAAGAEALERRLNSQYAPVLKSDGHTAVEVKANPAAASGFDIHFFTVRAGARFEIKGHLCQEHLETLQDSNKCELLRPGTILRLSPPQLIIRRRRGDGGEERVPELPDVNYLRITAAELQKVLNHPVIRRDADPREAESATTAAPGPAEIVELRLHRNPLNKVLLSLEIVSTDGSQTKAFTHHNVVELQHQSVFRPNLHVALSLDNRTLSVLDNETHRNERIVVDPSSPDSELQRAAQMLSEALRPATRHAEPRRAPAGPPKAAETLPEASADPARPETGTVVEAAREAPAAASQKSERAEPLLPEPCPNGRMSQESAPRVGEGPITADAPPAETEPSLESVSPLLPLFAESDSVRVNIEIFRRLELCLGLPAQRIELSLDRVFHRRPFEIISFTHAEVSGVLEIHSENFAGFYLSHINERNVILDYAWHGKRIEWGPGKCWVRPGTKADPEEFSSRALLGMALRPDRHFVFVVTPEFKRWIAPRQKTYEETAASFVTVEELASSPRSYPLVWPVPEA